MTLRLGHQTRDYISPSKARSGRFFYLETLRAGVLAMPTSIELLALDVYTCDPEDIIEQDV